MINTIGYMLETFCVVSFAIALLTLTVMFLFASVSVIKSFSDKV
jgi:hypothetical protein